MKNAWAAEEIAKLTDKEALELPTPSGESQSEFMERCMGDSYMKDKFPRLDQRVAVCLTQWGE
jgi:hypothetical protein